MMRICAAVVCLVMVFVVSGRALAQEGGLTLVEAGRAKCAIVMPSNRDWKTQAWMILVERQSAACLQGHLEQMSGVKVPVVSESALGAATVEGGKIKAGPGGVSAVNYILLGEGELAKKLGVTSEGLTAGGYKMKVTGNALVLVGHPKISHPREDGGGLRHAVVALLEAQGVRYLWPGEAGKVVPSKSVIKVDVVDVAYSPVIKQRRIRPFSLGDRLDAPLKYLSVSPDGAKKALKDAEVTRVDELADAQPETPESDFGWVQWQGLGGDIGVGYGHSFGTAWARWGKEHPEWFALQMDGTRDQSKVAERAQLCVSNEGLMDAIAQDVLAQAAKDPSKPVIGIDPNDGTYSSFCMCENCKKLDPANAPKVKILMFAKVGMSDRTEIDYPSLSDRYVHFWNGIAVRVAKVRPDLKLGVSAYSAYSTAPVREKLHESLIVRYVPNDISDWEGWRKAGAKVMYWRPNLFHSAAKTAVLRVRAKQLVETYHKLVADGAVASDIDSLMGHWSTHGFSYYAAAKLNWDPSLTYEAILDDYCTGGFGPAAGPVKAYLKLAEEATPDKDGRPVAATPETILKLRELLAQADTAAGSDKALKGRIAFLRVGLNHTELFEAMNRIANEAKEGKAHDKMQVRQLMDLVYLSLRDMAMNNPNAINIGWVVRGTGYFAPWENVGARNYKPAPELLVKVDEEKRHQTGQEKSLAEMLAVYGIERSGEIAPRPRVPAEKIKTQVDADENGRAIEVPAK